MDDLIVFDRSVISVSLTRKPYLRVSKGGLITINKSAGALINVNAGDSIKFYQDKKKPANWMIKKSDDELGFTLRDLSSGNAMGFNAVALAKTIMKSLGRTESFRCPVGAEADENGYLAVITSALQ